MKYQDIAKKQTENAAVRSVKPGQGASAYAGIPNSAMLSIMGRADEGNRSTDALERGLWARMSPTHPRAQAQIPEAENEADRLSAAITGGSPESVKADMGRRMGADFSHVRFHTGAAAAAKADAMGARAFTSGADVYFGEGGFDASVAAHELVHTAQQGVVSSDTSTMSTPVGGVQMKPNIFKRMWNATGGRAIRKHHDAMNELHELKQSGEWDTLTPEEQAQWKKSNRLAYRRYTRSDKVQAETALRVGKRQMELEAARDYLAANEGQMGPSSQLTRNAAGGFTIGHGQVSSDPSPAPEAQGTLDQLSDVASTAENAALAPDLVSSAQESNLIGNTGASPLNAGLGTLGVMTGMSGSANAIQAMDQARRNGDATAGIDGFANFLGGSAQSVGGAATVAKSFGAGAAGKYAAGAGMVTGSVDMYRGGREIHEGRMKSNAMNQFIKDQYGDATRDSLSPEDLLLRDIASQGRMEGTRQKIEGSGQVITGAMDATASALDLTGVGAAGGTALKAASLAGKAGFAAANQHQKNRMVKKVVEQTTGLNDEKIRQFQKASGIDNFNRAKQALVRGKGVVSGQRAELYARETERRGQYLADTINNASPTGDIFHALKAKQLVDGLRVKPGENSTYNATDISKAIGYWKSGEEIANGQSTIRKIRAQRAAAGTP